MKLFFSVLFFVISALFMLVGTIGAIYSAIAGKGETLLYINMGLIGVSTFLTGITIIITSKLFDSFTALLEVFHEKIVPNLNLREQQNRPTPQGFMDFLKRMSEENSQTDSITKDFETEDGRNRVTIQGLSQEDIAGMPDNHPIKKMLSSIGIIDSKKGKRTLSEMTDRELEDELREEEADEKQDFEKCALIRDEILRREQANKNKSEDKEGN